MSVQARWIYTLAAAAGALASSVRAADYKWQGVSGNWSAPANWVGGAIPASAIDTRILLANQTWDPIVSTVDASQPLWQINTLVDSGNSISGADTLAIDSASLLQFVGDAPFIQVGARDLTISGAVSAPGTLTTTLIGGNGRLQLNGPLSGGSLAVQSGTVILAGANNLFGGISLNGGLKFTSPAAMGSTNVTMNVTTSQTAALTFSTSDSFTSFANTVIINGTDSSRSAYFYVTPLNGTVSLSKVIINGASGMDAGFSGVWRIQSLVLNGTGQLVGMDPVYQVASISEDSPRALVFGTAGTLQLTGACSYSGGTVLKKGMLIADAPGALGSGDVSVSSGTLTLNATNAAQAPVTLSAGSVTLLNYNANGAAGGHPITGVEIRLGPAVTSLSNGSAGDTFTLSAGGALRGNSTALASLDRGVAGAANLVIPAGAAIENTDGALPTVQNLGTNADLLLLMHTTALSTVTIGAGTPWSGLGGGLAGPFVGTAIANGPIQLSQGTVGSGSGSFNIQAAPGIAPVDVTLNSVTLQGSLGDFSGAARFLVNGTATVATSNALGGAGSTSPITLEVSAGNTVVISNQAAINGTLLLHAGSALSLYTPLTGIGSLQREDKPVSFYAHSVTAFAGTQLTPDFVHAGDTVYLDIDNVQQLGSLDPAATYVIDYGSSTATQSAGFQLNGGTLRVGSTGTGSQLPALGGGTVVVGPLGANITAHGIRFTAWDALPHSYSLNFNQLQMPIVASGPIQLGSGSLWGTDNGGLLLANSSNSLGLVNVVNVGLSLWAPSSALAATITLTGSFLGLPGISRTTTTEYDNTVQVLTDSVISNNYADVPRTRNGKVTLDSLSVGSAKVTLDFTSAFTVGSLTLTGDASVRGYLRTTLGTIQDDGTPHMLTLGPAPYVSPSLLYAITGPVTASGAVNIAGGGVVSYGTWSRTAAAVTVSGGGFLGGTGTLQRPVIFDDSNDVLSPGPTLNVANSSAGTFTLDSLMLAPSTSLLWNLDAPGAAGAIGDDLLVVNGDLTLDGALSLYCGSNFGVGSYTLMTYGGTLTDNGLTLPVAPSGMKYTLDLSSAGAVNLVVTSTPEPASLALLLPAALLRGRRKRGS